MRFRKISLAHNLNRKPLITRHLKPRQCLGHQPKPCRPILLLDHSKQRRRNRPRLEQVGGAVAVQGREGDGVAEAELEELPDQV